MCENHSSSHTPILHVGVAANGDILGASFSAMEASLSSLVLASDDGNGTRTAARCDGENDYVDASELMTTEEIEVAAGMEDMAVEVGTDDEIELEDELRREEHEASKRIRMEQAKLCGSSTTPIFPAMLGLGTFLMGLDAEQIKFDPSSIQTETAEEIEVVAGMEDMAVELGTDEYINLEDELRREEHEASKRIRMEQAKLCGSSTTPIFPAMLGLGTFLMGLDAEQIKFDPSSIQTETAEEIEVVAGMEDMAVELGTDEYINLEDELRRYEHEASRHIRMEQAKQRRLSTAPIFPAMMGMVGLDAEQIKFDPSSIQTKTDNRIEPGANMRSRREACTLREAIPAATRFATGLVELRNSEQDMAESMSKMNIRATQPDTEAGRGSLEDNGRMGRPQKRKRQNSKSHKIVNSKPRPTCPPLTHVVNDTDSEALPLTGSRAS